MLKSLLLVATVGVAGLAARPGAARTYDTVPPVAPFLQQGSTINNAAIANEHAPGDAEEIAPDTRQTATGGPSGDYGRGGAAGGA